jgi:hypothetical protein
VTGEPGRPHIDLYPPDRSWDEWEWRACVPLQKGLKKPARETLNVVPRCVTCLISATTLALHAVKPHTFNAVRNVMH